MWPKVSHLLRCGGRNDSSCQTSGRQSGGACCAEVGGVAGGIGRGRGRAQPRRWRGADTRARTYFPGRACIRRPRSAPWPGGHVTLVALAKRFLGPRLFGCRTDGGVSRDRTATGITISPSAGPRMGPCYGGGPSRAETRSRRIRLEFRLQAVPAPRLPHGRRRTEISDGSGSTHTMGTDPRLGPRYGGRASGARRLKPPVLLVWRGVGGSGLRRGTVPAA